MAFRTLFFASFGQFDFDTIGQAKISHRYGYAFIIIFLIFNIGLFMSLFVAIVTVLYHIFQKKDRVYQMVETLKVRSTTQADKRYSVLISVPVPFNFFLIFAAPILINHKHQERCNTKLLMIFYMPILAITSSVFLAVESFMWIFVYLKMVFHKLTMTWVYSRTYRSSRADKFMNFVVFLLFGPAIVIGNTIVDLQYFIRHMVRFDLQKIKAKTRFN